MPRAHRSTPFAVLLALALLVSSCASEPERRPSSGAIVVGSDLDNAPFAFVDGAGQPAGRDVEMMERIADLVGRELVWKRLPFGELVDACALGQVDVVCATLGVTPERARRVRFTHGYFETELAVLVRADSPVQTLDDLVGRRVGAGAGTTSEKAVYERLRFSHAIVGPKSAELLERGEVDAVVMDAPAADRSAAESGGELRVLAEDVGREVYALAVAPYETELLSDLDDALAAMRASGSLAELDARYGLARRPKPAVPPPTEEEP